MTPRPVALRLSTLLGVLFVGVYLFPIYWMVTGSFKAEGDLFVYLGRGDGTFQERTRFAVGSTPVEVIAEDLNHDGRGIGRRIAARGQSVGIILCEICDRMMRDAAARQRAGTNLNRAQPSRLG